MTHHDLDDGDSREWRMLVDDPMLHPPMRLTVLAERHGLIRIGHVAVTSRSEHAEEMRGGGVTFWIRRDELRWLIDAATEALQFVEETTP